MNSSESSPLPFASFPSLCKSAILRSATANTGGEKQSQALRHQLRMRTCILGVGVFEELLGDDAAVPVDRRGKPLCHRLLPDQHAHSFGGLTAKGVQHQPCLSEGEILLESGEDRVRGRQRALDVGQSLSQLLLVIEAQPDEALVCLRTRAHRLNNR